MVWRRRPRESVVEDVSHLLEAGWSHGRVRIAHASGGPITVMVNGMRREQPGGQSTLLLTLPARLAPLDNLFSTKTMRGHQVRCLTTGELSIDGPSTSLDYLHLTYVPRGGA